MHPVFSQASLHTYKMSSSICGKIALYTPASSITRGTPHKRYTAKIQSGTSDIAYFSRTLLIPAKCEKQSETSSDHSVDRVNVNFTGVQDSTEADWGRNILAEGTCTIIWKGNEYVVGEPGI